MLEKITVVCPHCKFTGTYDNRFGSMGSGSQSVICNSCHMSFKINFLNGKLESVTK